jgi:lipopolysaccharide export system permease protein
VRILWRYVVSEFLRALFYGLAAFCALYVLVDLFDRLDLFMEKRAAVATVVQYYLLEIPYIVILTLPVAMLLASLLSVGQMARHNELVAIRAAGASPARLYVALFAVALVVSVMTMVAAEFVVPRTNERQSYVERVQIKRQPPEQHLQRSDLYLTGTRGRMYYVGFYDGRLNQMRDVSIKQFSSQSRLTSRLDARGATWEQDHWTFSDGILRRFSPQGEELAPIHFQRTTIPDLEETPADFVRPERKPEEMGYLELRDYIGRVRRSGGDARKEMVDLFLKVSFPFANFIIILFGVPLSSRGRKSGAFFGFWISLVICFVYWGFLQAGRALGHHGDLSPFWAAWLPNIIFGGVGLLLLWRSVRD